MTFELGGLILDGLAFLLACFMAGAVIGWVLTELEGRRK